MSTSKQWTLTPRDAYLIHDALTKEAARLRGLATTPAITAGGIDRFLTQDAQYLDELAARFEGTLT